MLDTRVAVTGKTLLHGGKLYAITSAGVMHDEAFATVEPYEEIVAQTIIRHIRNCMPRPFSLEEVQRDLAKPLSVRR